MPHALVAADARSLFPHLPDPRQRCQTTTSCWPSPFSHDLPIPPTAVAGPQARWHPEIGDSLVNGAKKAMEECGVKPENIIETEVPGSFELPLAARYMALSGTVRALLR